MSITPDIIDRTRRFEGVIPYMYLDTEANVTVGVGKLLPNASAAQALPFVDKQSAEAASDDAKAQEWQAVSALAPGNVASYYDAFTKLKLQDVDINQLLESDLEGVESDLKGQFSDYDTFPAKAQAGLIDMGFNLGVPKLIASFPMFVAAVRAQDWKKAADQCHRKPPVSDDRNTEVKQLFLDAASGRQADLAHWGKREADVRLLERHLWRQFGLASRRERRLLVERSTSKITIIPVVWPSVTRNGFIRHEGGISVSLPGRAIGCVVALDIRTQITQIQFFHVENGVVIEGIPLTAQDLSGQVAINSGADSTNDVATRQYRVKGLAGYALSAFSTDDEARRAHPQQLYGDLFSDSNTAFMENASIYVMNLYDCINCCCCTCTNGCCCSAAASPNRSYDNDQDAYLHLVPDEGYLLADWLLGSK